MAKPTITPWRSHTDLLRARSDIYNNTHPPGSLGDTRALAIARILAWKQRNSNLPHAVESTALLTDAILHHQAHSSSATAFSIRAVYSAAFTRFVTGFCDIGRNRERSLEPSSMLTIARQIGMPVHFVALRHEATHEELPSVQRLVRAAEEGLEWLWKVYWSRLEEPKSGDEGFAKARAEGKVVLKAFRSAKLACLRGRNRSESEDEVRKAGAACGEVLKGGKMRIEAVVNVLVEDRLLCPSKRELGSPLDGAYLIWDDLLRELATQQRRFFVTLVKSLLQKLSFTSKSHSEKDAEQEAWCLWLIRLVASQTPMVGGLTVRLKVMEWCCTYPGHWSNRLGSSILESADPDFESDWRDIFEASLLRSELSEVDDAQSSGTPAEDTQDLDDLDTAMEDTDIRSWVQAARSGQVPIGVVR